MKLHLITEKFADYRRYLASAKAKENLFIWTSQRLFQEQWSLEEPDIKAMYEACLDNPHSRRLWNREHYEPKRAMLQFLDEQPEFIRGMFKDLFEESKGIESRCSRFSFYCDELLEAHREARPKSRLPDHYHGQDYHMISLYLCFRYPDQYTLYDFTGFRNLLEVFEAPKLPEANDLERFFKLTRTLFKLMQKDEDLLEAHRKRLDPDLHFMGDSLLLVYDFSSFVLEGK